MASPQTSLPSPRFVEVCGIVQGAFQGIEVYGVPAKVHTWWKSAVEKHLSKQGHPFSITIEGFERQGDQIYGALLRYKSMARIYWSTHLNACWQRYVIAKELAHLLIDTPAEYTKKPSSLMKQLVSGIPLYALRRDHGQDQDSFFSEKVAMAAAIEMLIPWRFRPDFIAMSKDGLGEYELAMKFRVPKHIVANTLDGSYAELSSAANKASQKP